MAASLATFARSVVALMIGSRMILFGTIFRFWSALLIPTCFGVGRSLTAGETPKFTALAYTGVSDLCARSELKLVGGFAWLTFGCVGAGCDGLFLARLACVIGSIKSIGSNNVTAMIVIFLTCVFILVLQVIRAL